MKEGICKWSIYLSEVYLHFLGITFELDDWGHMF